MQVFQELFYYLCHVLKESFSNSLKYLQSLCQVSSIYPRKIAGTRPPFLDDAKDLSESSDEIDTEPMEFKKSNSESFFLIIMQYSRMRALICISWHRSATTG